MELYSMYSQVVEVKILEYESTAPAFLGRKENLQTKRSALCQVWIRLKAEDEDNKIEKMVKDNFEEKVFKSCYEIYSKFKSLADRELTIRLQEQNKWMQIGDFEP